MTTTTNPEPNTPMAECDTDDVYIFPTSFAQQRLWFTQQLDPDSAAYNVPLAVQIEGPLQVGALEKSINAIVERHEMLRTTFTVQDGEPMQVIHPQLDIHLARVDLDELFESDQMNCAKHLAAKEVQQPFDLGREPPIRARLLNIAADNHVLVITIHHIACDGWSMGIFIHELTHFYTAFIRQQQPLLPALSIQYADFAEWQRDYLSGDRMDQLIDYWTKKLGSDLPNLNLPTDQQGKQESDQEGDRTTRLLPTALSTKLRALTKTEQTTPYVLLLTAFNILLSHESQQDDMVVGTDVANRNRREIEGLIGIFVNQLVLRTDLSGDPTFAELVQQVRRTVIDATDHQDLPFDKLVEAINPERTASNSPLFQAKFVFQNTPSTEPQIVGLTLTPLSILKETARFDLLWTMRDMGTAFLSTVEYRTDLYSTTYIERLLERFDLLLQTIVAQPKSRLSELVRPLIEADAQQQQQQQQAFAEKKRRRSRVRPNAVVAG